MKDKGKKIIVIIVIIGMILIAGILFIKNISKKKEVTKGEEIPENEQYVGILEDGNESNKSNNLKGTKKVDGMEITQIQLTNQNGVSKILATVTNKTDNDIEFTPIKLTLYDNKKQVLGEVNGLISPMKAGESVQLDVGITIDYTNVYDLKIEKQ